MTKKSIFLIIAFFSKELTYLIRFILSDNLKKII